MWVLIIQQIANHSQLISAYTHTRTRGLSFRSRERSDKNWLICFGNDKSYQFSTREDVNLFLFGCRLHAAFRGKQIKENNSRAASEENTNTSQCLCERFHGKHSHSVVRSLHYTPLTHQAMWLTEKWFAFLFRHDQVSAPFLSLPLTISISVSLTCSHWENRIRFWIRDTRELGKIVTVIIDSIRVDFLWNANLLSGCQSVIDWM